jgi:predicted permease
MMAMRLFGEVLSDLRHGLRLTQRSPGFTVTVVFLLALGIGTTTAVFSVFKAALLTPLPYPSPDRLTIVWETETDSQHTPASPPNFLDWRDSARSFRSMAAISPHGYSLSGGDEPVYVLGALATAGLFEVFGVEAALGRTFLPGEDRQGADPVVVLSHRLWQRSFGGSPEVLGRTVRLDGEPHTVIGVLRPASEILTPWTLGQSLDAFTPLPLSRSIDHRDSHWLIVVARLADGVTRKQAEADIDSVAAALAEQFPDTNRNHGARVVPLHKELFGWTRGPLLLLLGAAGAVLFIVCANVGGLLLTKAADREGELAVRLSLGASRRRLLRQLLLESVPLVVMGAAAALLVAIWTLDTLGMFLPYPVARAEEITLDGWGLCFTTGVSILTVVLISMAPALLAFRVDLTGSMRVGGDSRIGERTRSRARRTLVVAQIALTLILANAAVLLLASYGKLRNTDFGFEPEEVLTVSLTFAENRYEDLPQVGSFFRDALPRVRALPGVRFAATTNKLPFGGGTNGRVVIEGREADFGDVRGPLAERSMITPGYFRAMGIRLLAGRVLSERDLASEMPVAVVNETMADLGWHDTDPIGKRFLLKEAGLWITVVGVVSDVRQWGAEYPALPEYYIPFSTLPAYWSNWQPIHERAFLVVRSDIDPQGLVPSLKRAIREVDPHQPVADIHTMTEIFEESTARRRFNTLLVGSFAGVAIVLVASGIYGLMSLFVSRRRREFGVRMALGAEGRDVLRLVLRQGIYLIGFGMALGLVGMFASTGILRHLLYGVSPMDLAVVVVGSALVAAVGLIGSLVPAMRASRVNPAIALRRDN